MSLEKSLISTSILFLLLGCGGSSNSPAADEAPVIDDTPVIISCSSLTNIELIEANSTDEAVGYSADKAIDGSFIQTSRWSTVNNDEELTLTLGAMSLVKGMSITWLNTDQRTYNYDIETSQDNVNWLPVLTSESSDSSTTRSKYSNVIESTAKYIKIIPRSNNINNENHIVEVEAFGCKTNVASSIELTDWYLSIPVDESVKLTAENIYESALNDDYFNAEFFFLSSDGGLVFRSPIEGARTSVNTSYTRTELREMLRRGNTNINTQGINQNNWVFSSASSTEQNAAGGVDGDLTAELSVNHVTTTGDDSQVGRVIIGQIHANNDEPIRVYYRKLPGNNKGSIYFAHEILDGDDIYHEIIGTRSKSASDPENGIQLNERFGYNIKVVGHALTFTLSREGQSDLSKTIDMSASGYDLGGQYMYFKAGVYNQNNTGDPKDYVQATFYQIDNSHDGYLNE